MATSASAKMKAWQYTSASGGLDKAMKISNDAAMPKDADKLGPDQVLVKVLSMSLNPVDYKVAELPIVGRFVPSKPASPGLDFAGRVVTTGPNSGKMTQESKIQPGQLVFGRLPGLYQHGTLGGYVIADRSGTVAIPEGVEIDDAAGVGTAGLTAYQSIIPNVKSGDSVFINGGSGGTGVYGIQFGKAIGCYVATCCSTANVELCKSLGADEVIDYKQSDVATELKKSGRKYDLVVDNVGIAPVLYWQAQEFTKPGAKYVQVGAGMSFAAVLEMAKCALWPSLLGGGQRPWAFLGVKNQYDDFAQIAQWMKEGKVKAVTDEVFSYENAPRAFEKLKTGRAKGKIVVRVEGDGR